MNADPISDVLRAVRLDGAFFFKVEATEPWWVESADALQEAPRVLPRSEHLIPYHVLVEGECWGGVVGGSQRRLRPGDVIVFPHGHAHRMSSAEGLRTTTAPVTRPNPTRLPFVLRLGEASGRQSILVCGFLGCDRRPFNPLLAALPDVLLAHGEADGWQAAFSRRAIEEAHAGRSGGELMLTRLAELMFIDVVRRHVDSLPESETGWLAGVRDEIVGKALALLHGDPTREWSLDLLARATSCSRSVLAERFARLVGEPPVQYLTRWRMQLAALKLSSTTAKVASVAREVGYDSEAAFSRAFKRLVGVSPAVWRARAERPTPTAALDSPS
jgi:AraC-like DNA-binding protein